jgi:malate/lactate dehydrogenase
MRIAIVGTGNTAAATLLQLSALNEGHDIRVIARDAPKIQAALLDVISAYPRSAARVKPGAMTDIRSCDVLLLCAGIQAPPIDAPASLLEENTKIARTYLEGGVSAKTQIVVIGTPVDNLTTVIAEAGICAPERIMGFGGDLDTARLHYILAEEGIENAGDGVCIGEHGGRTIPVYRGEARYPDIAGRVRNLFKTMTANAGAPKNLAVGPWLAKLALALTEEKPQEHIVCGFMQKYGLCLTWPRRVSKNGLGESVPVTPGPSAQAELDALLEKKRAELPGLRKMAKAVF